jgi:hypothetical protein
VPRGARGASNAGLRLWTITLSLALASAPLFSRRSATAWKFMIAATCNGVAPCARRPRYHD